MRLLSRFQQSQVSSQVSRALCVVVVVVVAGDDDASNDRPVMRLLYRHHFHQPAAHDRAFDGRKWPASYSAAPE